MRKKISISTRESSVEREGGIKWVGGLFNRPGGVLVPLTLEATGYVELSKATPFRSYTKSA